jgi:hypothetical protein
MVKYAPDAGTHAVQPVESPVFGGIQVRRMPVPGLIWGMSDKTERPCIFPVFP